MPVLHLATYNATLPISRLLVPELFSNIIHHALDPDPLPLIRRAKNEPASVAPTRPKRRLGVAVNASQVCFAWRTLCVGTPTIWARQIGDIPRATTTFLERSGRALLDITAHCLDPAYWSSAPPIDSSRIRSLEWHEETINEDSLHALCALLGGNLLNLGHLSVSFKSADDVDEGGVLESPLSSLGSTPRLTGLWFHGVYLSFATPRLTILSLHNVTVTSSQLLGALRSAPLLRAFEFIGCRLPTDFTSNLESLYPSGPNPVELRRLRSLHMETSLEDLSIEEGFHSLLDNLRIRPTSTAIVMLFGMPFPLFVISLRTGLKRRPLTLVRLEGCWEMWNPRPRAAHLPPSHPAVCDLALGFLDGELTAIDHYGPLLHDLNLPELQHITEIELCVHICGFWRGDDELYLILRALPNVTTCWISRGEEEVDHDPTEDCIALLWELASEGDQSATDESSSSSASEGMLYPFPLLTTLGIKGHELVSDGVLERLLQTLTDRDEAGYPDLNMLSLPDFSRPSGDGDMLDVAEDLEEQADTVHWGRRVIVEGEEHQGDSDGEEGLSDES